MRESFDITIVGGGPAGTAAAACAAKRGLKACIVDRSVFPRDKICGDYIAVDSLKVFEGAGIDISDSYHLFLNSSGVSFIANNSKHVFTLHSLMGLLAKRADFDTYLLSKIRPSTSLFMGYSPENITYDYNERKYCCKIKNNTGSEDIIDIYSNYIIAADGATSFVRRCFFKKFILESAIATREYCKLSYTLSEHSIYYFEKIEKGGYFWTFPMSESEVNCGVILYTDSWKKNFSSIKSAHIFYKENILGVSSMGAETKAWQLPLNVNIQQCSKRNILLVGDAAGLVNPIFGNGIDNAIYSGEIAVRHIFAHYLDNNYDLDGLYSNEINKRFVEKHIELKELRNAFTFCNGQIIERIKDLTS